MHCQENGIEHRLTKDQASLDQCQVERMNHTIKEATVQRYHYDRHDPEQIQSSKATLVGLVFSSRDHSQVACKALTFASAVIDSYTDPKVKCSFQVPTSGLTAQSRLWRRTKMSVGTTKSGPLQWAASSSSPLNYPKLAFELMRIAQPSLLLQCTKRRAIRAGVADRGALATGSRTSRSVRVALA